MDLGIVVGVFNALLASSHRSLRGPLELQADNSIGTILLRRTLLSKSFSLTFRIFDGGPYVSRGIYFITIIIPLNF